jgi:hypothetical protein
MRIATLVLALFAFAPFSASAAPFGEPPYTPVPGNATCLRATGVPGELVRWSPTGARFVQAGASGFTAGAEVRAGGEIAACPAVAAQPGGAGVLALIRPDGSGRTILGVALREPGGAWSAPATLAGANPIDDPAVAVSDRGDAVLVWAETSGPLESRTYRVRVTRRPAGGTFGAPQTLATIKSSFNPRLLAGVSASGEAIVAWTGQITAGSVVFAPPEGPIDVAIAPPGAPFGGAARIGTAAQTALAVAPDGRALLALAGGGEVRVAERAPGQAFAAPAHAGDASDLVAVTPAVALRADGGAVVAWQGFVDQSVVAVTRTGPGAFAAPLVLARPQVAGGDPFTAALNRIYTLTLGAINFGASLYDSAASDLRAALAPDGRALLTWGGLRARSGIGSWVAPRLAALPLARGHVDVQALGGPLRNAGSVTPLILASGAPAIAWTDNDAGLAPAGGRLHLALEGVTTGADPPAPKIAVGSPAKTVLSVDDSLRLPVRCSAACELRAAVVGRPGAEAATQRAHAGSAVLDFQPSLGAPIAPLRRGPVRVVVAYGAPGAWNPLTKTVTVTLRRPPGPPVAHVRDLRARRRGGAIEVTWTTDVRAKPDDFLVTGTATASPTAPPLALAVSEDERTGRRFHFTLRPSAGVRYVSVSVATETFRIVRRGTVRVSAGSRA